jgi:hypothetical protein
MVGLVGRATLRTRERIRGVAGGWGAGRDAIDAVRRAASLLTGLLPFVVYRTEP